MEAIMTFITGENKVINIGPIPKFGGSNGLEMILRESGRFIIRGPNEFIALSEKKTRTITVSGTIGAGSSAEHFAEYETNPGNVQMESGDMFPQDLLNEYPVDSIQIYGIATLLGLSIGSQPTDAVARLLGGHIKYWISRQPLTSWNEEDLIGVMLSAYQTLPQNGLGLITEGVVIETAKKRLIPIFSPIKSSFPIRKIQDKLYLYSEVGVLGYCEASTAGGSITGSAVLDQRLIIGIGFLPEEVEELLSPSQ
ncbi:MAG: hypothetical protein CEE42_05240 [Promethearchaeota archaeon Loki_b31]|nr:MAG: hypothetical protein CEE42_05240 [Candidatus Lokiarchaeota archaeon Loki_b31]